MQEEDDEPTARTHGLTDHEIARLRALLARACQHVDQPPLRASLHEFADRLEREMAARDIADNAGRSRRELAPVIQQVEQVLIAAERPISATLVSDVLDIDLVTATHAVAVLVREGRAAKATSASTAARTLYSATEVPMSPES